MRRAISPIHSAHARGLRFLNAFGTSLESHFYFCFYFLPFFQGLYPTPNHHNKFYKQTNFYFTKHGYNFKACITKDLVHSKLWCSKNSTKFLSQVQLKNKVHCYETISTMLKELHWSCSRRGQHFVACSSVVVCPSEVGETLVEAADAGSPGRTSKLKTAGVQHYQGRHHDTSFRSSIFTAVQEESSNSPLLLAWSGPSLGLANISIRSKYAGIKSFPVGRIWYHQRYL